MKKTEITETIELIKGTFPPDEAREILLQLLDSKINFHNRRNFSSRERFGKADPYSEQRLEHLTESRKKVLTLVSKSTDEGKTITINSTIEINVE
jgi:hypothetical protein